jgi:3'-phosphoadenosine 5'-phosphosulfate sulfotransferase (PAPS reductase)/FAD synthetase
VTVSPYTLPDGNVQIAFSGGRTSGYMLRQIIDANGGLPDRVRVIFCNTGREMPETLDFVAECADRWSVPVVWLEYAQPWTWKQVGHNSAARNGEPLDAIIMDRGTLPNPLARFCSSEGKRFTADRYIRQALGWDAYTKALGFRADEAKRSAGKPRDKGLSHWFPLIDAGVSRFDVVAWWQRQPFDLRLPVVRGRSVLGNCDGCFLKSEKFLAQLSVDYPERAAWWEQWEAKSHTLPKAKLGAFSEKFRRADLRDFMDRHGDLALTTEGMLCQADGGECME